MAMKNLTYLNRMAVIRRIEAKDYDFETAERLTRNVLAAFQAAPEGLSIEQRVNMILTKAEWEAQAERSVSECN